MDEVMRLINRLQACVASMDLDVAISCCSILAAELKAIKRVQGRDWNGRVHEVAEARKAWVAWRKSLAKDLAVYRRSNGLETGCPNPPPSLDGMTDNDRRVYAIVVERWNRVAPNELKINFLP